MKVELLYAEGQTFVAYIPENASENVMACLLDDDSVTVTRKNGKGGVTDEKGSDVDRRGRDRV